VSDQVVRWPHQSMPANGRGDVSRLPEVDLSKLTDVELMLRLREGEQEALSHLFDRYHRLVLSIASKIIRDHTEAEDVMQEVFFEVYRVARRFDATKGSVKPWIVQFAYHRSLNRRRYLALRGAFEDAQIREFDPPETTTPRDNNGHTCDDILAIVQQGFATLTAKQREAVELACFEGLLFPEIAERTKESLGNVRHHYYRGIDKLREFVRHKMRPEESERAALQGGRK
jgi:RNA polymerase sigma-70 factor (ECF subfamily)